MKKDVMWKLLVRKFKQEPFKTKLLETGNRYIIEGNFWNDVYWGYDLKKNTGTNLLGNMLMEIRKKLRNG